VHFFLNSSKLFFKEVLHICEGYFDVKIFCPSKFFDILIIPLMPNVEKTPTKDVGTSSAKGAGQAGQAG
jgi:hypothetical protein